MKLFSPVVLCAPLRNPQRPALKIKVAFRQTSTAPAICRAFLAAMSADQPTAAEAQCSWSSKKIIANDAASFQSFSCSVVRLRRMLNSVVNLFLSNSQHGDTEVTESAPRDRFLRQTLK